MGYPKFLYCFNKDSFWVKVVSVVWVSSVTHWPLTSCWSNSIVDNQVEFYMNETCWLLVIEKCISLDQYIAMIPVYSG